MNNYPQESLFIEQLSRVVAGTYESGWKPAAPKQSIGRPKNFIDRYFKQPSIDELRTMSIQQKIQRRPKDIEYRYMVKLDRDIQKKYKEIDALNRAVQDKIAGKKSLACK